MLSSMNQLCIQLVKLREIRLYKLAFIDPNEKSVLGYIHIRLVKTIFMFYISSRIRFSPIGVFKATTGVSVKNSIARKNVQTLVSV